MTQIDVLEFLIEKGPGRTQVELAKAIHGDDGYQQQVNQDLELLTNRRKCEKRGAGGAEQPFRYFPTKSPQSGPDLRVV
jgi:hypothetical protein